MARILIVDDSESIRCAYGEMLASAGHTVEVAAEGYAALEKLLVMPFDFIVVDYDMPGLSGIEVLRQLERLQLCSQPVPIMISMFNDLNLRHEALMAGARAFFAKDQITPERLLQLLSSPKTPATVSD